MRAHLQYLWYRITASLWLVPGLMIFAAVWLAFAMLYLDTAVPPRWLEPARWFLRIGPEGARQVLATIAGSMITVASLVFSMTLVTLTLASSQLGPRLITRFMRDPINQVVLGTFLATFVYALLVLETVSQTEPAPFVPHLSITLGLLLTLISLFWLIFFIHHVAVSIQADAVIADVSDELSRAIANRFPQVEPGPAVPAETPFLDRLAEAARRGSEPEERLCPGDRRTYSAAPGDGSGSVDQGRAAARRFRDRGYASAAGLAARAPVRRTRAAMLRDPIVIGRQRTPTQDIDFAVSALVEIALRALSPGINDPQTAIACIDRLAESLAEIMRSAEPPSLVSDEDGVLRLMVTPASFEAVAHAAFNPIREAGRADARVLRRLADVLAASLGSCAPKHRQAMLASQTRALEEVCRSAGLDDLRRQEVDAILAVSARSDRRGEARLIGPEPASVPAGSRLRDALSLASRPRARLTEHRSSSSPSSAWIRLRHGNSFALHRHLQAGSGLGSLPRLHAHGDRDRRLAAGERCAPPRDRASPARAPARRGPDQRGRQPAQAAAPRGRCRLAAGVPAHFSSHDRSAAGAARL